MRRTLRTALVVVALATVGIAGSAGAAKLITGKSIKNGSIGLADLSASAKRTLEGKVGTTGPQGPQGPAGARGAAGPASITTTVRVNEFVAPPNDFADGEVRCPSGMVAVGGSVSPGALFPVFDGPSTDGRGWLGSALEANGQSGNSMLVFAICTPGTPHVLSIGAAASGSQIERLEAEAERDR